MAALKVKLSADDTLIGEEDALNFEDEPQYALAMAEDEIYWATLEDVTRTELVAR